jgi:photosystem II stability/assembly factor-like uncharacterized protein
MSFIAGTSSGVYLGPEGAQAEGLIAGAVHHLSRVNGTLFAGSADGIYRSGDDGRSWKRSGAEGCDVWHVTAHPSKEGVMFAGTQPAHMLRSWDAGSTWESFDAFLNAPGADRWCLPGGQTARALTFAVDPFNAQHFVCGVEVGGVVSSEDGGQSWNATLAGENADIHVLVAHPNEKNTVYATTGHGRNDDIAMDPRMAGLYRSQDGGRSWQYLGDRMEPFYTRPICIDPRPPFAVTIPTAPAVRSTITDPGGAQSVLFQSSDGGETWQSLGDSAHSPSDARLTAVIPDEEQAGWVLVGTETGEIWRVSPDCDWSKLADRLPPVLSLLASS